MREFRVNSVCDKRQSWIIVVFARKQNISWTRNFNETLKKVVLLQPQFKMAATATQLKQAQAENII